MGHPPLEAKHATTGGRKVERKKERERERDEHNEWQFAILALAYHWMCMVQKSKHKWKWIQPPHANRKKQRTRGVCHTGVLPFYIIKIYLKAKEELWKLKYISPNAKKQSSNYYFLKIWNYYYFHDLLWYCYFSCEIIQSRSL